MRSQRFNLPKILRESDRPNTLKIFSPSGQRFLASVELDQLREQERQRADEALAQLEQEQQRYQALLEQWQERGIDPEQLVVRAVFCKGIIPKKNA